MCAVCSRRRWRQVLLQYCLHHRHLDITTEPADEPAAAVPAAAAPATADPAAAAPAAAVSQSVSRCRQLCQTTSSRARGALMGTSGRTSMHGQVPMDAASLAACEARGTSLAAC